MAYPAAFSPVELLGLGLRIFVFFEHFNVFIYDHLWAAMIQSIRSGMTDGQTDRQTNTAVLYVQKIRYCLGLLLPV